MAFDKLSLPGPFDRLRANGRKWRVPFDKLRVNGGSGAPFHQSLRVANSVRAEPVEAGAYPLRPFGLSLSKPFNHHFG
jgi:hypothetical protein